MKTINLTTNHLLKCVSTILVLMLTSIGHIIGEDAVYKQTLFNSDNNSAGNSSYTGTWSNTTSEFTVDIANFNNNNNGWTNAQGNGQVKCGRKNNASVATITTDAAIDKAITKVVVTIDAITSNKINSIKLYTSSNGISWTEAGSYTKSTGAQSVSLSSPTANLYYKVEFDCASGSSNGLLTISKVEYYAQASAPHTVSFNTGTGNPTVASRTETSGGAGITLPSTSDLTPACSSDGWVLYGWTTAAYGSASTTSAPTTTLVGLAGENYSPNDDITLYAVYKQTIVNGEPTAQTLTGTPNSHSGWEVTEACGTSYWVLCEGASITSPTISDLSTITSVVISTRTYGGASYKTTSVATSGDTSVGSVNASGSSFDNQTISPISGLSGSGSLVFTSTTTSISNGPGINSITINYTAAPSTTYYWSTPTCCTSLGTINGSVIFIYQCFMGVINYTPSI